MGYFLYEPHRAETTHLYHTNSLINFRVFGLSGLKIEINGEETTRKWLEKLLRVCLCVKELWIVLKRGDVELLFPSIYEFTQKARELQMVTVDVTAARINLKLLMAPEMTARVLKISTNNYFERDRGMLGRFLLHHPSVVHLCHDYDQWDDGFLQENHEIELVNGEEVLVTVRNRKSKLREIIALTKRVVPVPDLVNEIILYLHNGVPSETPPTVPRRLGKTHATYLGFTDEYE
jgi:hypothetical protein